jgi:hypothetical protein
MVLLSEEIRGNRGRIQLGSTHRSGTAWDRRQSCRRGEDEVFAIGIASGSGARRDSVFLEAASKLASPQEAIAPATNRMERQGLLHRPCPKMDRNVQVGPFLVFLPIRQHHLRSFRVGCALLLADCLRVQVHRGSNVGVTQGLVLNLQSIPPRLRFMEVHFKPETELRLKQLALERQTS